MLLKARAFLIAAAAILLLTFTGCGTERTPGNPSYWDVHGFWFLIFMNLFPRLTMLIATPFPVGFLGWTGWLLLPRLYAAILATHFYWDTNALLCVITWIVALGTTGGTNNTVAKKVADR